MDTSDSSDSSSQLAQMILIQLEEIRRSNEALTMALASQESRHREQITALQQDFEARLASQTPPVAPSTGNGGNAVNVPVSSDPVTNTEAPPPSMPPSDPPAPSSRPQLSERLPDPPMFTGKKKDLALFLTKLKLKLRGNADRFPDEASRLIYAHSRLDSDPATLINPLMDTNITSVDLLVQFLESTYGDPNKELTAWSRLDNLKQGKKNFTSHFANFRQIIADANLNEAAQISQLRRTLADNIREKMAGVEIPETLDAYANLIQRYDNDLRYLPSSRPHVSSRTARYPVEMEIDASATTDYAPKNSAERQKRIKEGRCFKCGKTGHISPLCPLPMPKQQVLANNTRPHDDSDSDSDCTSRPSASRTRGRTSRTQSSPPGNVSSRG